MANNTFQNSRLQYKKCKPKGANPKVKLHEQCQNSKIIWHTMNNNVLRKNIKATLTAAYMNITLKWARN